MSEHHNSGDAAEIRRLVAEAVRLQSDEAFVGLHTDDVRIVNIAGRRVRGRPALADAMSAALASPLADVLTTVDVEDIVFLRPDVAIVSCVKHVHDGRDGGAALPASGSLTYVLVREGEWRIASAQTTPIIV
ncbi:MULTISPECIES: SgcJ/EcaC family oxidoreductase [unclassified Cryobacterium]|uniref:SgcJ/EcaC family oxidoreductase n=1 Tax=unclassified Cryobacterium TaxID=2649013 RepID=UPI00144853CF|nr:MULTISPECIES: SgcJ/EcaC family oxidoreductase [unclassified Cryobacterium]